MKQPKELKKIYLKHFGVVPTLMVNAPGRINLLGEHTDYNQGFVLPAAIDKSTLFAFGLNSDKLIRLIALDLDEYYETPINDLSKSKKPWANYLLGVIHVLQSNGHNIKQGFNVIFGGNIPLGAGLSSSAALEAGMCFGLNELFDFKLSKKEMALYAQMAEQTYAGVNCGIMDMYASLFGQKNALIKLDCRDISHEYLDFNFPQVDILLVNTGVKHNLAESAYNTRRQECESGLVYFNQHDKSLLSLRDLPVHLLEAHRDFLPENIYKRCKYVVQETSRMLKASEYLSDQNLKAFGQLMYQTHDGLSNDYEVSCRELDFLVKISLSNTAVYGARMMGGGFGGCTINLVDKSKTTEVMADISAKYTHEFGIAPEIYIVKIADGCHKILMNE